MLAMSCALCTGLQLVLNLDLLNTAVFQKLPNYASAVLDYETKSGGDVHSVLKLSSKWTLLSLGWFSSVLFVNFRHQISKSPLSFFVSLRTFMVVPFNPWYYLYLLLCITCICITCICICYCVLHVFVFAFI